MAVYGSIIGQGLRAIREIAHRELVERSPDAASIELEAPNLSALAIAPDEIVNVSSLLEGWGSSNGSRRIARLKARDLDGRKRLRLILEDLEGNQRIGLLDELESPIGANGFADGVGAILPHSGGGGFNGAGFFRVGPAWVWDEVSKRVIRAPQHVPATEAVGLPLERVGTNLVPYSGFSSGLTGWSTFGTGVNGSSVVTQTAADTTPLFDPAAGGGMPYSIKMTAGNPHTASPGMSLYWVSGTIGANNSLCISFDYINEGGEILYYFVNRSSDGFYWNGLAFAAGVTFLPLPLRTAHAARPFYAPPIVTGAAASTFTIGLEQPSGGTASRVARVFHFQVEVARWCGTRIVNEGASPVSREESDYCYANESGRRSFPATRGTAIFKGSPYWSTSRADGGFFFLFSVPYDASNEVGVLYDGQTSTRNRLVGYRRAAGVTYSASSVLTVVEDAPLFAALRWASTTDGELDSLYGPAPGGSSNFDLWGGTSGAVVRLANGSGPVPTESADSRFQVGGRSGDCFDGRFSRLRVFPYVLSDQELLRWCI